MPPARAPAVGAAGLGTSDSPPAILPGEHFAAALAFFIAGAVGLALVAPDLASGLFYLPRVVAVVHLFALGWIVLSIYGALCQFLPVAVGRPIRSLSLAHTSFGVHVLGVALFVGSLATGTRGLLHAGAGLLAASFVLFAVNLVATLAGVRERSLTWWALAGSAVFIVVTPIYGVSLALNIHGDVRLTERFAHVAAHAHVAIVGFVMLVIVGVAHRLLPMFLLSHGASERPAWASLVLLFAGAAILAVPLGGSARFITAGALIVGGLVAFLAQAALFFHHRKRRAIDPGMRLAAAGLVGLALATLLAPFALTRGLGDLHLLATYFVVLLGAISLFVAGQYYKIVPFLVWFHRFGPFIGKKKVPKVSELYSDSVARINGGLLVSGWVGVAVGTYLGVGLLILVAALVFAAGAALEAIVVVRIAQRKAT
jgi:hypothetical protein